MERFRRGAIQPHHLEGNDGFSSSTIGRSPLHHDTNRDWLGPKVNVAAQAAAQFCGELARTVLAKWIWRTPRKNKNLVSFTNQKPTEEYERQPAD
jgi:hypothetical protein